MASLRKRIDERTGGNEEFERQIQQLQDEIRTLKGAFCMFKLFVPICRHGKQKEDEKWRMCVYMCHEYVQTLMECNVSIPFIGVSCV